MFCPCPKIQRSSSQSYHPQIIHLNPHGRVILSGGNFGTSRLLFQSGIGPADMIAIVANDTVARNYLPPPSHYINLPVGLNITDNPGANVGIEPKPTFALLEAPID